MTKFRQLLGYEFEKITNMQGGLMVFRLWVLVAVVGLAPLHGGQSISACAEGDASQSFQSSVFSDQCFAPLEFELVDFRSPVDGDVVTDGHGSVRGVTGSNGLVEEEFDYDAYGVLLGAREWDDVSGQMVGVAEPLRDGYFYSGERWDSDLGMYYLRARYWNAGSGRFHTMDDYEGRRGEPVTLHKYLYGNGNPVSGIDPSGRFTLTESSAASTFSKIIDKAMVGARFIHTYQKVTSIIDAISTIRGLYTIVQNPGAVVSQISQLRSLKESRSGRSRTFQDVISPQGVQDGLTVFARNAPRALAEIFRRGAWKEAIGKKIRSFIIYMPTPETIEGPKFDVPLALRVRGVPVVARFGDTGAGRFLGVGLGWGNQKKLQLYRMDWHKAHGGSYRTPKKDRKFDWSDDSYHFHVAGALNKR